MRQRSDWVTDDKQIVEEQRVSMSIGDSVWKDQCRDIRLKDDWFGSSQYFDVFEDNCNLFIDICHQHRTQIRGKNDRSHQLVALALRLKLRCQLGPFEWVRCARADGIKNSKSHFVHAESLEWCMVCRGISQH